MSEFHKAMPDPSEVVKAILADALRRIWDEMASINACHPHWATRVGGAWLRSLCRSFRARYTDEARFAVFGGRPSKDQADIAGKHVRPNVVLGWRRWEFLYDITVVELDNTPAAYHASNVTFIKRAIWQVESEVAKNGTEVAEDLSKLRVGAADHKLLLISETAQRDPQHWLDFIGRLCAGMTGDVFLGLMPTYSATSPKDAKKWRDCTATITLYHWRGDGSAFRLVPGCPITAT